MFKPPFFLLHLRHTVAAVPARLWLVGVLLLGFLLRVVSLGRADLWLDEAISYFIAEKPFWEIVLYTASNAFEHPPGYYILLHLWMGLAGTEEFALRFLSVFGSLLSVALSVALAHRWFGRDGETPASSSLALLVGLLMALQPMVIHVGREVRMYAWMMALALLTMHAFDRALYRNRWRDWGLFLVTTGLAVLFHYMAAFFVAAYALFGILFWRRLPASRTRLITILAVTFGAGAAWILTQPGPRNTLLGILSEPQSVSRFIAAMTPVYTHWALGEAAFYLAHVPALLLALLTWVPAVIGVIWMQRLQPASHRAGAGGKDSHNRKAMLRWLVLLFLVTPPVLRALVFALPNVRHSAMVMGVFVLCIALGIVIVQRRSRILSLLMILGLVSLDGVLWARELQALERPFSVPLAYIQDRARDQEPVVYTHPFDWLQNLYYNARGLPAHYIPGDLNPISPDAAAARAGEVLGQSSSAWLLLYPSVLEPERVERAFNDLAFPSEKVWFPGGRGVIHYATARSEVGEELHLAEQPGGVVWDHQIRLNRWSILSPAVMAGDALRVQFEWQRVGEATPSALVVLSLTGPDGAAWARRVAAPCNGLCPLAEWPDAPVDERQALFIPADTPPGAYQLRLAWVTEDGAPILGRPSGDPAPGLSAAGQVDFLLLDITITAPSAPGIASPPLSTGLQAAFGPGLRLLSLDFADPSLRAGQTLALSTQWAVAAPQPALALRLDLAGPGRQVQIVQPLGPSWYPAAQWTPGRTVRASSRFTIPGDLPPGEYRAALAVLEVGGQSRGQVPLGHVRVLDRPRSFTLPDAGLSLDVAWQDAIQLARAQLPARAVAGQTLEVMLAWQAAGSPQRNWKVFIHLVDAQGGVPAQGDAYPALGEALTSTWQKDEVIVDTYSINLPPDLPAGSYAVRLGFYDEPTGERLPLAAGGDAFTLPVPVLVDVE